MQFRKLRLDWRYGLGELLIVVSGVLIALWAEGWREGRARESLEREYVESLVADLTVDTAALSNLLRATRERAEHVETVLTVFDTRTRPDDPVTLLRSVEYASYFAYPDYTTRTIDDLTSTGNLRLIRSGGVRRALEDYYAEIEWTGQFEALLRPVQGDLALVTAHVLTLEQRNALLQEGIRSQCGVRGFACVGTIPWAPEALEVGPAEADEVLRRLLSRPEARAMYAAMGRTHSQHFYNLTAIHSLATKALETLGAYVESTW